jgi:hypothetical protein
MEFFLDETRKEDIFDTKTNFKYRIILSDFQKKWSV